MFDQGETFSGIDYNQGLKAVEALKKMLPNNINLVNIALKWVLMHEEVSCVIPEVSKIEQLVSNLKTLETRELTDYEMTQVKQIYNEFIRPSVHHRW